MNHVRDRVVGSFWLVPAAMALAGGLLAVLLTWADSALWSTGVQFGFAGGPDAARGLLSVIASSTLTLAGLTFSVTLVVLTLASSQYSPRILRTFLTDQRTKLALGVFLGTYVYALVTLRVVRSADEALDRAAFVPGVALTVAFVVALVAIGVFALFIDHVVQSIRVESIIERIAADTREVIDRVYPVEPDDGSSMTPAPGVSRSGDDAEVPDAGPDAPPRRAHEVAAPHPGVISSINLSSLIERARDADAFVQLHHGVGRFVPAGALVLTVVGSDDADAEAFLRPIALSATRTLTQDVAFGLRQLVDIAERALSPGVNDPTTAVQALDQIHDLLRRLATRPLGDGRLADDDGVIRLELPVWTWDDYVALALDEVRHWGAGSLQVSRELGVLLDDLLTVVDDTRAQPLRAQRRLLDRRVTEDLPEAERDHRRTARA